MSKNKSKKDKKDDIERTEDSTEDSTNGASDSSGEIEPYDDSYKQIEPHDVIYKPTEKSEDKIPVPDPQIVEDSSPITVDLLPKIALKIFERIAGPKWDQLAGFKQYAKANKLGPMSVPAWRGALAEFKNKPTKPTK